MMTVTDNETIALTREAEIVLFELLSRFSGQNRISLIDQAEENVLIQILGDLKRRLTEPFDPDYAQIHERALRVVRGGDRHACPCCQKLTLRRRDRGSLEICPVCYWKDDPGQFENPMLQSRANACSLQQARENYANFGYSDRSVAQFVRRPYQNEMV